MSKYKVGDKIILTVTGMTEMGGYPYYVLNDNNFNILVSSIDKYAEPLTTYTEPLERKNENKQKQIEKLVDRLHRQAAEITRLLAENERLKAENEKMSVKIDDYELYGDQHEEEYNQAFNQGAETAWELAKKIYLSEEEGGYDGAELFEIFNEVGLSDIYRLSYHEAVEKVAEWEKANEEIKVGDVLEDMASSKVKCVVTNIYPSNMAYLVFSDGSAGINELENMKKTGRRIDIDGFLKQIGGNGNER